jgi:hypothetical protein
VRRWLCAADSSQIIPGYDPSSGLALRLYWPKAAPWAQPKVKRYSTAGHSHHRLCTKTNSARRDAIAWLKPTLSWVNEYRTGSGSDRVCVASVQGHGMRGVYVARFRPRGFVFRKCDPVASTTPRGLPARGPRSASGSVFVDPQCRRDDFLCKAATTAHPAA